MFNLYHAISCIAFSVYGELVKKMIQLDIIHPYLLSSAQDFVIR